MNDFIDALKEDLLDRRLLPFVALAAAALLAAAAYVVLGGSSESSPTAAVPHPAPVTLRTGVSISAASAERVLAETTSGGGEQRQGSARNPFDLLPGALAAAAAESAKSSSTSAGSSSSRGSSGSAGGSSPSRSSGNSGGSGSSSGSSAPPAPSKPSKPNTPKTVYSVDVLFGEIPAGTSTSAGAGLAPYANLKLLTPLPSSAVPLVVYRGVKASTTSALFTVAGEAILSGNGACKPSAYQCEAISLKAGQSEQLQYLPPGSSTVRSYELRVTSVSAAEASAATISSLWRGRSAAGLEVLRGEGLLALPGLRTTSVAGVLVPVR